MCRSRYLLPLVLALLAACSDATGPGTDLRVTPGGKTPTSPGTHQQPLGGAKQAVAK